MSLLNERQSQTASEISAGIAALLAYQFTLLDDTVVLGHPVKKYGFELGHHFNMLDGSIASKALCLDLLEQFSVTYHPKRPEDQQYRFGQSGPYARCGSHEPIYDECPEKAICLAVLKTYGTSASK